MTTVPRIVAAFVFFIGCLVRLAAAQTTFLDFVDVAHGLSGDGRFVVHSGNVYG